MNTTRPFFLLLVLEAIENEIQITAVFKHAGNVRPKGVLVKWEGAISKKLKIYEEQSFLGLPTLGQCPLRGYPDTLKRGKTCGTDQFL